MPDAPNPLMSLLAGVLGKSATVDVKPKADGVHIQVDGIEAKIALKHIRNLLNELIGE